MRLCRFALDDLILTGFYGDDRVIPIDQAVEAYVDAQGIELLLPATTDLLDLLPGGPAFHAASALGDWLATLDAATIEGLAIPVTDVQLLTPIASPSKILLLAGNYAAHVAERGGTAAERAETFPYVFLKPPSTTLTHPGDPVVIPAVSPDHIDWECELGVVIGQSGRDIAEAEALEFVAGYTVVNDISDRKFTPNPDRKPRERDKFFDWLHGKWHDTFLPDGSVHPRRRTPGLDPQDLHLKIHLSVNGRVHQKQDASTGLDGLPRRGHRLLRLLEPDDARTRRHHQHRHALRGRLGQRHLSQARRRAAGHDRGNWHAGESGGCRRVSAGVPMQGAAAPGILAAS